MNIFIEHISLTQVIKILTITLSHAFFNITHGQEICNDGIDNDMDGNIDLNDDECNCQTIIPSSLIPNPSFEEKSCCPTEKEELSCADFWVQASSATSDYLHADCPDGILVHPSIGNVPPLPPPDGYGYIGIRDGTGNGAGEYYKEYVGTCINGSMETYTDYRMDFFLGFHHEISGSVITIALYGTVDCENDLPFGGNSNFSTSGCPTNYSGWELIAEETVYGQFEWINVIIEFQVDEAYNGIVLGPSCAPNPNANLNPYFFIDRLMVAETAQYGEPLREKGAFCNDSFSLSVEDIGISYQWYLNGIALEGETGSILMLQGDDEQGVYKVIINKLDGCYASSEYILEDTPVLESFEEIFLCEGDTLELGNRYITEDGIYTEVLSSYFGCDSIASVDVYYIANSELDTVYHLCENEVVIFGNEEYSEEGIYDMILTNIAGCDSLMSIEIIFEATVSNLQMPSDFKIELGDSIALAPSEISEDAVKYSWCVGSEILSNNLIINVKPSESTTYLFKAYSEFDCSTQASISIEVDNQIEVYQPNVFTPEIENNKYFKLGFKGGAIAAISKFYIYDRWGNNVYEYSGTLEGYVGWDGKIQSVSGHSGVYSYVCELELINSDKRTYFGNVTLIY